MMGKEDSSMFPSLVYRTGFAAIACAAYILLAPAAKGEQDVWPALRQQTFGDRQIQAEDGAVILEIPGTAEDASLVPLTVRVPPAVTQKLKSLTLFIDKNPDPLVASLSSRLPPTPSPSSSARSVAFCWAATPISRVASRRCC